MVMDAPRPDDVFDPEAEEAKVTRSSGFPAAALAAAASPTAAAAATSASGGDVDDPLGWEADEFGVGGTALPGDWIGLDDVTKACEYVAAYPMSPLGSGVV